ncbi:MAG: NADP(H)-dependent aldo-keto reductase [Bacteroidetes bacterium]|nr:NADP(H)-dependent aldo-keto reductase [Bacteroidota bacterium]
MEYNFIPNTKLNVSRICLGTMTFGEQNTEAEAHQQLDYAVEQGINFIDAAEMYPVPRNEKTQGRTEEYIGNWAKKTGKRNDLILATKITGPDKSLSHIRDPLNFSKEQIHEAVNGSLKRLKTDYIDLYQLHWPERKNQRFGIRYYEFDANEKWEDNFHSILECLDELIKSGKIKYVGISNESPWGVMRFLEESKKHGLQRMVSIQNAFSLLNRTIEYGLSEICLRENLGLLAYSPLAFGLLSGKYYRNEKIEKARLTLFPQFARYKTENAKKAVAAYCQLAEKNGLIPAQMALAYIKDKPFVSSYIIGATSMEQLKENIESINIKLDKEVKVEIEKIMEMYPDAAP